MHMDFQALADAGAYFEGATGFLKPEWKRNASLAMDSRELKMAMDAQPALFTSANAAIPALMTTLVDPTIIEILFAPMKAAKIMGSEVRKGDWTDDTIMFKLVEPVGEVSSYNDFSNDGHADANVNYPQRQSYLYQTNYELGEREVARYGKGGLDWAAQKKRSAVLMLDKFQNLTYFFGVNGLQNYGLLNDPSLSAALTPSLKAFGNHYWVTGTAITATANEIYGDIQSLFYELVAQTDGLVDKDASVVLTMPPGTEVALTATNTYNVNVADLLKKNFPNIRIENAVQYSTAAGNLVQMFVEEIDGEKSAYPAYNEKLRAHRVVYDTSSWKQKHTQGTWGTIIRRPIAFASMLGV